MTAKHFLSTTTEISCPTTVEHLLSGVFMPFTRVLSFPSPQSRAEHLLSEAFMQHGQKAVPLEAVESLLPGG